MHGNKLLKDISEFFGNKDDHQSVLIYDDYQMLCCDDDGKWIGGENVTTATLSVQNQFKLIFPNKTVDVSKATKYCESNELCEQI